LTDDIPLFVQDACVPQDLLFAGIDLWNINHRLLPCEIDTRPAGEIQFCRYTRQAARRRHQERVERLRRRGRRVHAVLVQANAGMYEPGDTDLPGLVLISFERIEDVDLEEIAERVYWLKQNPPANAAEARVASYVQASEALAVYHRREQLPLDFTNGRVVYVCDLWFHRPYLEGGLLLDRWIDCLAEPGKHGGIEHVWPI
jgi:hypothetical protein